MANQRVALDRVLHALADPTRRTMLERMSMGSASISDLAGPSNIALPTALKHVAVLEAAGLVQTTKRGRVRACSLQPAALDEVATWITERQHAWHARLGALARALDEPRALNEQGDTA